MRGRGHPGALIAAGAHEAPRAWDPAATAYHTTHTKLDGPNLEMGKDVMKW